MSHGTKLEQTATGPLLQRASSRGTLCPQDARASCLPPGTPAGPSGQPPPRALRAPGPRGPQTVASGGKHVDLSNTRQRAGMTVTIRNKLAGPEVAGRLAHHRWVAWMRAGGTLGGRGAVGSLGVPSTHLGRSSLAAGTERPVTPGEGTHEGVWSHPPDPSSAGRRPRTNVPGGHVRARGSRGLMCEAGP